MGSWVVLNILQLQTMLKWVTVCMYIFILLKIYHQLQFFTSGIIRLKCNWLRNIVIYYQVFLNIVVLLYILPSSLWEWLFPQSLAKRICSHNFYETDALSTVLTRHLVLIIFSITNHIDEYLYLNIVLIQISLILSEKHYWTYFHMPWTIFICFWWVVICVFPIFYIFY